MSARVTSTEALDQFRSSLVLFLNKAHAALDQTSDEIRRTRHWVRDEQRAQWESEARKRARILAQAEQELLSARLTRALDNLNTQQAAVHKARHALDEAEAKLRKIRLWTRDYDSVVEPLAKGLNTLRNQLDHELPQGIAWLAEAQKTLENYASATSPAASPGEGGAA